MAATTTLLGLVTPTQGTLSGTWGDTVNYGISDYVDISVAGTLTLTNDGAVTLANTTGSSSGNNITSSLTGAGTVTAQFAIVRVTGTLTVAKVVTGPSYSKTYTVVNAATGGIVTFKASGQTGVSIAVGESALVYFNGTDYVKVAGTTSGAAAGSTTQVQFNSSGVLAGSANLTFDGTNLTVGGSATATRFIPSGSTVATNGMYLPAANSLGFSTNSTLSVTIDSTQQLGIGSATAAGQSIRSAKAITGSVNSYGFINAGIVQSDVTSNAYYFRSSVSTAASAFTLTGLSHYSTIQGTIGAGSTVTNQYGYLADSTLTGATNNYGFYGGIASGTGRYNLYMAGTADNYMAGSLGIGDVPATGIILRITKGQSGATSAYTISARMNPAVDVTSNSYGYVTFAINAVGTSTTNFTHFYANQGTFSGTAPTNQYGFVVESSLTGATNNYGYYGGIASGTGRYNLYMAGTADNYLAGSLGIGGTPAAGINFRVTKNITGATVSYGSVVDGQIQSDVTSTAVNYLSSPSTQATAFTLNTLQHFRAVQGTFGAGSSVTTQSGFFAAGTLTGATTNIGFHGNIASGTGRYNIYMEGTAQNYFAGNVGIATTSPGSALDVKGTLRLSGSTSGYVGLAPAAAAGSTTYTLPSADGSASQFLQTNGSGTLSWATASGGGSAATPTALGTVYGITPAGTAAIALGYEAANTTTGALGVVAVGYQALKANTANYNTAVGYASGLNNTSGKITAFGASALVANTTGQNNYAFGGTDGTTIGSALQANTTGANNSAFAGGALLSNTTGTYNSAFGMSALYSNTTANSNTAVGYQAAYTNVTGTELVALGYQSLYSNTGSYSTAVGHQALKSNTTGGGNCAFGDIALFTNTTGSNNVAMGVNALNANTTADSNSAFGTSALRFNTTGASNTAVGLDALRANTTASNNTAVGFEALKANTTAEANTAIGYQAAKTSTTATRITAVGMNSLLVNTVNDNTAVGYAALQANTTGANNVAVGCQEASGYPVMYSNTTGSSNTALGAGALSRNTTASNNTAVGYQALYLNTTGAANTAVGRSALDACTTGNNNVAVGYDALGSNTTGYESTAIGYQTLGALTTGFTNVAVGAAALGSLTTGNDNVAMGNNAGKSNYGSGAATTTGNANVFIGAQALAGAAGDSNSVVIGSSAVGKGGSTAFINGGNGNTFNGGNTTTWNTTSDQRLKKNIVDNNDGLDKITSIRVRNFEYRLPEEVDAELKPTDAIKKSGVQLGVIAQELQAVLPNCVKQETTGVFSVDPDNLTWYMINAIKELKAEFDAYKASHP